MNGRYLLTRGSLRATLALAAGLTLIACSNTITVKVPPRVDLKAYPAVAVIDFSAGSEDLSREATQKFIGNLQGAQPGIRLLELGRRDSVLKEIGRPDLDLLAIRAIGERYGATAVLTGSVELSEVRPDVNIASALTTLSAQGKIDGKMSAKLWETASGATVWTNSSWGHYTVGGVTLGEGGRPAINYRDSRETREDILMALIKALNGNFWPTYEKRKVAD